MEKLDLDEIRQKWLNQCGCCDAGLPMSCTCTTDDPRHVILALVNHLEDLYGNHDMLLCSTMGEAYEQMEKFPARVRFLEEWQKAAMVMLNMKIIAAAKKNLEDLA